MVTAVADARGIPWDEVAAPARASSHDREGIAALTGSFAKSKGLKVRFRAINIGSILAGAVRLYQVLRNVHFLGDHQVGEH